MTLNGLSDPKRDLENGLFDTPGRRCLSRMNGCALGTLPMLSARRAVAVPHEQRSARRTRCQVTGQTFETFLRERIFEPLGMKDTGFYVPEGKIDRSPPAYVPDPQTGEFIVG